MAENLNKGSAKKSPMLLQMGKNVLKMDLENISEDNQKRAKEELRETPEVVEEALKEIRRLVREEADLKVPDNDAHHIKFLRPCKWYPQSAFEMMKRFYRFRVNHQHVSENMVPSKHRVILSTELFVLMPERADDGSMILIMHTGKNWIPKIHSTDDMFSCTMLSFLIATQDLDTQIAGLRVIIDMKGFGLNHLTYITPSFASRTAEWIQRCAPCRLKGIHIVNQPFIFNMAFAVFKPFLHEKIRSRIYFHGTDRDSLMSHIGKRAVPTIFDGDVDVPFGTLGNAVYNFMSEWDEELAALNDYGYPKKP